MNDISHLRTQRGPRAHRSALVAAIVAGAGLLVQGQRDLAQRSRISWAPGNGILRDGTLHTRSLGQGAGGVVLLHGLGGSNAFWGAAYDTLAGSGRLVVPDLLGFGASPRPPSGYTPDDHVRALVTALDELGVTGPVVVGAHSVGCLVALALAARRPDLVSAIVAFCPPLYPNEETARKYVARLGWLERQLATDGPWAEISCRWVCRHRAAAATVASLLRPGLPAAIRRDGVQHTWASYSQTFRDVLAAAEAEGWLRQVNIPVELIAGANDPVTDLSYLNQLAQALPNVTLTVHNGADHDLPLTHPSIAVAALTRAVRSCDPATAAFH